MSDANWSNVVLRLTCNGSNGSTTFTDLSPAGLTVTALGNAQVSTAQSKWGGASLYLDGTAGTALSIGVTSQFKFDAGAWTVEFWIRPATEALSGAFLFQFWDANLTGYKAGAVCMSSGLMISDNSDPEGFSEGYSAGILAADTWYHIEVSYDGTNARSFIDGTLHDTWTASLDIPVNRGLLIGSNKIYDVNPEYWTEYPFTGYIDDIRVTKGVARHTASFTPPSAELSTSGDIPGTDAYLSVDTMLGAPAMLGQNPPSALLSDAGPLGDASSVAQTDFTGAIDTAAPIRYVVDLHTPSGDVRAPVSSWQATQQVDQSCYLQCVIPACDPYVDAIADATAFTVSRRGQFIDGSAVESVMATSAITEAVFSRSPSRNTCTLSGYSDAFAANDNPSATLDRTLSDVRLVTTSGSGTRVRCAIDWLLRPAQRAIVGGDSFVVSYINWYANADDEFMDIGSRNDAGG